MTMRRRFVGLSVKVTVDDGGCCPIMFLDVADRCGKFRMSVGERGPRGGGIVENRGTRDRVGHIVSRVCEECCSVSGMDS
jgi:hypothetical protein